MVRQTIRKVIAKARNGKRRNRVWMIIVKGDKPFHVSPALFKEINEREPDQLYWREKPEAAAERLKKFVLNSTQTQVGYLGKYEFKGTAPYQHLYVVYVICAPDVQISPKVVSYLVALEDLVQKELTGEARLAGKIWNDLQKRLSDNSGVITYQVVRRYSGIGA